MSAARVQRLEQLLSRVQERRRLRRNDRESGEVLASPAVTAPAPMAVESEPPMEINVPDDLRSSAPPYDPMTLTDPAPRPAMPRSQRPDQPSPVAAHSFPPVAMEPPETLGAPAETTDRPELGAVQVEPTFGELITRTLQLRPKGR